MKISILQRGRVGVMWVGTRFLVMFLMCLAGVHLSAQPVISSVSPLAGYPSSSVTISGSGFNTTAANNIVYFGATRATVTAASSTSLGVTVPAGATYQAVTVNNIATGLSAFSPYPFLPGFDNSQYAPGAVNFDAKVDFATGSYPVYVASGDIDGDGKPDLAVANNTSNTVSLYRNISAGGPITAGSFTASADLVTGADPMGILITDIDGDGKPDVVVADRSANTVSVFRNTSTIGSISFAAKVDFTVGGLPWGVVAADIDGDGKPDLAVTNELSGTISVLRNTSAGGIITFAAKVDFSALTTPRSIAAADIDGDGKPDLTVVYSSDLYVSVFRNTSVTGSVAFAAKVDIATPNNLNGLAVGDIDGDGKPDLSVTNVYLSSISIFRNTSATGSVSFATKVDFTSGLQPWGIAMGDVDGDGKPDLAVSNLTGTVSVLRNTSVSGSLILAPKVDFATALAPSGLVIDDMDGDGKPDIVTSDNGSNTISIFRNDPPLAGPTITSVSPNTGNPAAAVTITGTHFNSTPGNNIVYFGATRATVTAASSTSLGVTVPTGATYQDVTVNNTASGLMAFSQYPFLPTFNGSTGFINFNPSVDFATGSGPFRCAIADIDGDGKPDVVVTNFNINTVSVYRNISAAGTITSGSFAPKVDFVTDANPLTVVIGDVDGDGKPDIVVTNESALGHTFSVLRNTSIAGVISSGSFAPYVSFPTGISPNYVAISDIDGDGKPEVIVTSDDVAHVISVYRNICSIGTIAFAAKVDFAVPAGSYGVAIGDLDGDGKPDVAVADNFASFISVYRNTATAGGIDASSFAAKVDFPIGSTASDAYDVIIRDIDGDGKQDLVVVCQVSNKIAVLRNTATSGSINISSFAAKVDFPVGNSPRSVAAGDIDGDGKPDLIVTNLASNTVSVLGNTATPGSITSSSFAAKVDFTTGSSPLGVAVGDLDGDGKPDLVIADFGVDKISILRNNAHSSPPTITSVSPNAAHPGAAVTITGTNFNTTPGNNIVYFGATGAAVSAASATSLSVTVPTGATYQDVTVNNTASGLMAFSQFPFLPSYDNSLYVPGVNFDPKVDFATGSLPQNVTIADIDGDGKADLVVTNYSANTISVYRNTSVNGSVTASSFAAPVTFVTSTGPTFLAIGDVDGDGKPDVAVIAFSSVVSVFRNTSVAGAVSFAARVDYGTTGNPGNLAIGDLDGDGKADIVVADYLAHTVSVYRNVGGAGAVAFAVKVDFAAPLGCYGLAIGDLDGDGKPDLAVADYNPSLVSVYRNTATPGIIDAGSLAAKVDFSIGATGSNAYNVLMSDVDGDGKLDLAVLCSATNTIAVLRNTATSGTIGSGSFAAKVDFPVGTSPRNFAAGDIDGDGKPDLVVTNYSSNTVSVLRNTAVAGVINTGSFAAKVDFTTGNTPMGMAVGDLDGDGRPDVAIADYLAANISILRNDAALATPTITSVSPNGGSIADGITITGTNFNTTPANDIVYFGAVRATVAAASSTSLSVLMPAGATYHDVTVNNTAMKLTAFSQYPFLPGYDNSLYVPGVVNFDPKVDFTSGSTPYMVAIGDIDGDGKPDVAVTNFGSNTVSVHLNTSVGGGMTSGSFATSVDFITGASPTGVAIGDIDGDGKPDLVVTCEGPGTISVFRNTSLPGGVSFAARVDFAVAAAPRGIVIRDMDGDGKPDIAVSCHVVSTVSVLRNTSVAGFVNFAAPLSLTTGLSPYKLAIGDVDGDGKPDLVTANVNSNDVSVFHNTSLIGSLAFAPSVDFAAGLVPEDIAIGDLDGDNKPDLVVTNGSGATVSVIRNLSVAGSIAFAAKVSFATGATSEGVGIADIDGDGIPDIAVANYISNTVSVLKNISVTGILAFAPKADFATATNPRDIAIGDLDGDGKPDLVVTDQGADRISILRNNPPTHAPTITSVSPNVANPGDAVTITGTNFNTNPVNNIVYFGATRATVSAASATTLSVTVPTGATYQDVTVNNRAWGLVGFSKSPFLPTFDNSAYVTGAVNFDPKVDFLTGSTPQHIAIADIDGDGKPDVVVTNFGVNTVSVYRNISSTGSLTPGSFASKVDFLTDANPLSLVVGDVDGDGKPDIIVTNENVLGHTFSVLRNTSVAGSISSASFASYVSFLTGISPNYVALGDIDGDGKPEVIVTTDDPANVLSVYRNISVIGTIAFAAKVNFPVAGGSYGVAIGDLDGDGKPDLAVADNFSGFISLYRNTATAGVIDAGSFAPRFDVAVGSPNVYDVIIRDIDGDGKPDLVVDCPVSGNIAVLRNTASLGTIDIGSFAAKVDFLVGGSPRHVDAGDIDGDGKPDLVVTGFTTNVVSILRNTATPGSISTSSFAAKVDFPTGTSPIGVAVGDLDGDGRPDLAIADYGADRFSVLRNDAAFAVPTITSVSPNVANPAAAVTITGTHFSPVPGNNIVYFGATRATVSAASSTSLSVSVPAGATYADVTENNKVSGLMAFSQFPFLPTYDNSAYAPGLVNFDPKVDFAQGIGASPFTCAIADIDGDGKPDVVVTNSGLGTVSVYRNISAAGTITNGSFAPKVDFITAPYPLTVVVADVDGDGKPDITVTNETPGNTFSVLRNTSIAGTINAGSFAPYVSFTTGFSPNYLAISDIDGDGKPEVIVTTDDVAHVVSVYRNMCSSGTIAFAAKVDFAAPLSTNSFAIGDLDGDGKPDLAIADNFPSLISVYRNTATPGIIDPGSFSARVDFPIGAIASNVSGMVIKDFDGDGKQDLVVACPASNTIAVLRNTATSGSIGSGSFAAEVDFPIGGSSKYVEAGDIDGDGKPDLIFVSQLLNTVSILRNTATAGSINSGSFAAKVDFTTGGGPISVAVGDLDGDGKPDLAVADYVGDKISILRNDPTALISGTLAVCAGSNTALSATPSGGTWSSGNTSIGTVDASTGLATGIATGITAITYSYLGNTFTAMLTVNPLPYAGTVTGVATVCALVTTSLSDATGNTGGTWTSTDALKATVNATGVVTGVAAGTTTISYTVSNGCGTVAATKDVTVNAVPVAGSIAGTPIVCPLTTAALSDPSGDAGGTWSSVTPAKATIAATGVVTGVAAGTTTISYMVTNSCGTAVATTVATVNPAPYAGSVTGTASVCPTATAVLNDAAPGGVWSAVTPATATIGVTGVVTGVAAGTTVISYTVTNSCGAAVATTIVTVHPSPNAGAIGGSSQVCVGGSVSLFEAVTGGVWSSSAPGIAGVDASGNVTGSVAGAATISYSVANSCGTDVASIPFAVNPLPMPISGATGVCVGASTTLSDGIGGGTWTSSNGNAAIGFTTGIVTGMGVGVSIITYVLPTGCKIVSGMAVAAPPAPITGPSSVCAEYNSITMSDPTPGGNWSSTSGGSGTGGGAYINPMTGVFTGVTAGTATVSYFVTAGCAVTKVVTVNPNPYSIVGIPNVCVGGSPITLLDAGGGTWSSSNANATVGSVTGIVTGVSSGTVTITYTLPVTGCYTLRIVSVNTQPAPVTGTLALCAGGSATLADATAGGVWSVSNASASVGSATGLVTGVAGGVDSILYTVPSGCFATGAVTVNALPVAYPVTGSGNYCAGGTGVHVGLPGSDGGVVYQLYNGSATVGGTVSGTGSAIDFGAMPAGVYTVYAHNAATSCSNGMSGSAVITSTPVVVPSVTAASSTGSDVVCSGTVVSFTAVAVSGGPTPVYEWKVNGMAMSSLPVYGYIPSDGDIVLLTLTSSAVCAIPAVATAVHTMTVVPHLMPLVTMAETPGTNVCTGTPVVFTATPYNGGTAPAFKWIKNGVIAGVSPTYSYTPVNGDVVYCALWSSLACRMADSVASGSVTMNVNPNVAPGVTVSASPGTHINSGQSVTFTATVSGAAPLFSFQWRVNGFAVAGATASTYTSSGLANNDSVSCTIVNNDVCRNASSASVIIHVSTSVQQLSNGLGEFSLYPNPTFGTFTLQSSVAGVFTVYTLEGKEVQRAAIAEGATVLDLPKGLASGVYLCRFNGADGGEVMVRLVYEP